MPSKKATSSKKEAEDKKKLKKKRAPRSISTVGGGLQGGLLSGPGSGTSHQ